MYFIVHIPKQFNYSPAYFPDFEYLNTDYFNFDNFNKVSYLRIQFVYENRTISYQLISKYFQLF